MIWAVYTGYMGDCGVAVLVSAPTDDDAVEQAHKLLAAEKQPYSNLVPQAIELPALVELG